ncbi:MAG: metallophosphoesterase [Bacteroidota bacterium]
MNRFAFLTDLHIDESFPISVGVDARRNLMAVLKDLHGRGIDEIVLGGDLGENESNQWLFDQLRDFRVSLILGNHDEIQSVSRYFTETQPALANTLCYTTDDEYIKRIYLDSSSGKVSKEQLEWLAIQLMTDKPVVLFIHHCIFAVPSAIDREHFLKNRVEVQQLLEKFQRPVYVFSGHYNLDDVQNVGKVRQFITPAISYQVTKRADPIETHITTFGYRIVQIEESKLTEKLITLSV